MKNISQEEINNILNMISIEESLNNTNLAEANYFKLYPNDLQFINFNEFTNNPKGALINAFKKMQENPKFTTKPQYG